VIVITDLQNKIQIKWSNTICRQPAAWCTVR